MPRRSASSMTALLKGCPDRASAAAARRTTSSAETPFPPTTSVTRGRPNAIVPVLSRTMALMREVCSSVAAFLIRMLCRAPSPVPTATAVGVARPRASGQAMTTAEMAKGSGTSSDAPVGALGAPRPGLLAPPAGDLIAGALGHGDGLAGDQGFVDGRLALRDDAVHRDAVARPQLHDVARPDLAGGNFHYRAVAHHPRLRRHQVEEGLQRVGGAAAGGPLPPVGGEGEGEQHRRRPRE